MRDILLLFALLLLVPSAFAGPCLPGTLQGYILLGSAGCNLNQVQFQDFLPAPGANFATPIDPAQVHVTPSGNSFTNTLLFTVNSTANAGEVFESFFHYTAFGNPLLNLSIALGSPLITGDGAVTGIIDVCAGGLFFGSGPTGCSGSPGSAVAFATSSSSQLSGGLTFAPTPFFDVFVDITIDGGLSGSAFLDSAAVTTTTTPEPSNLLLIAFTVAALGTVKLRRHRRRSCR